MQEETMLNFVPLFEVPARGGDNKLLYSSHQLQKITMRGLAD